MQELLLRELRIEDERAFEKAILEFKQHNPEWTFAHGRELANSFSHYVSLLKDWSQGKNLPEGHLPWSFFIATFNGSIVGRSSIRHSLNSFLLERGGHIGYGVNPSERRRGYGRKILEASLHYAKQLRLKKILVTCDETNEASRKIIENCHGKYENTLNNTRRYWIENSS